jgi:hypothetical protein
MLNRPITLALAFAAGGAAIHNLSPFQLVTMAVIVAAIDYGSERLRNN